MLRSDDRLMHASSGCVIDVSLVDGRRRLNCCRIADEDTPLATASTPAWILTPADGGVVLKTEVGGGGGGGGGGVNSQGDQSGLATSMTKTTMMITRKSVMGKSEAMGGGRAGRGVGGGSWEKAEKKEIYVLEPKCADSRSTKEKYSQLFKFVVEADNVEVEI